MPRADNSAACFQIEHEPSRPPATTIAASAKVLSIHSKKRSALVSAHQ